MALELVTHIRSEEELLVASNSGYRSILLGHLELSPLGELDTVLLESLARSAKSKGLQVVLLWDLLMRDQEFDRALSFLESLNLTLFDRVRTLDPGALQWVLDNTDLDIELILRTGAHNLLAIQSWLQVSPRIKKVVLSSELPKKRLSEYLPAIKAETEILGLVPIQLFYTPRYLLTYQATADGEREEGNSNFLTAMASCDENTHKDFRVVESRAGTLFFHAKDYALLAQFAELFELGATAFQIDFRLERNRDWILAALKDVAELLQVEDKNLFAEKLVVWESQYPNKTTRCFYQANATDVIFKKIKNSKIQRVDEDFIGEVVESSRDQHLIVQVLNSRSVLNKGDKIKVITPMGKVVETEIKSLRNLNGDQIQSVQSGDFAVIPYLRAVTPTSVVYERK